MQGGQNKHTLDTGWSELNRLLFAHTTHHCLDIDSWTTGMVDGLQKSSNLQQCLSETSARCGLSWINSGKVG